MEVQAGEDGQEALEALDSIRDKAVTQTWAGRGAKEGRESSPGRLPMPTFKGVTRTFPFDTGKLERNQ
jgi:hypothetical protein